MSAIKLKTSGAVRKTRLVSKKIDSPLARYNNAGQLSCILCTLPVKSDLMWVAHVNGKVHRENVEKAKREKKVVSSVATAGKRAAEVHCPPKGKISNLMPVLNHFFDFRCTVNPSC